MKRGLGDKARLEHILLVIQEIEKYTSGLTVDQFLEDSKTHYATIKQMEIIGEAANHIDPVLLNTYSEVPWKVIRRFRNILVHEYFTVKLERAWGTVREDIPHLKTAAVKMLQNIG